MLLVFFFYIATNAAGSLTSFKRFPLLYGSKEKAKVYQKPLPSNPSVCDATSSEAISFWLTIKEKISTRLYSQTLPFVSGVLHILF